MSEQIAAVKSAAKTKSKTDSLTGLLSAGKLDPKDSKEFLKKLLELSKSGEIELDKEGVVRLTKGETKEGEIDPAALMSIKNLLSQIKLNDKLAIEKTIKELREHASKSSDEGKSEKPNLQKLLESAKEGGVAVKKIVVEKLENDDPKALQEDDKKVEQEKKESAKKAVKQELVSQEPTQKSAETTAKKSAEKERPKSSDSAALAALIQDSPKQKEVTQAAIVQASTVKPKETKEEPKEPKEIKGAKEPKESKDNKKEAQIKNDANAGIVSALKELSTEQSAQKFSGDMGSNLPKEGPKDERLEKKEGRSIFATPETLKHEGELKGKMAAASEALKNFSSDIKETIDNYRPPLMKVSMELNPQNMGAVDVTLISRGQNLIVNVTSAQETMQMFMQNIGEFRQNLMAQGFVSLQMNFNFSDGNKDQNSRQWQKEATKKYQINSEEMGKIESLDIIVPHPKYA